jgi:serine protease
MFSTFNVAAQSNYFYYYKNQKIYLTLDKSNVFIEVNNTFDKSSVTNLNVKDFNLSNVQNSTQKYSTIEFVAAPTDIEYFQKINALKTTSTISIVEPSFFNEKGDKIGMSSYFYVKLKNENDIGLLQNQAIMKNVNVIRQNQYMPMWYTLKCNNTTIENTLQITNVLFETGLFEAVEPDFMIAENNEIIYQSSTTPINTPPPTNCVNDPSFSLQWGLQNNHMPNLPNSLDVDINACEAWSISKGNGVKVAVFDGGIQLNHPDLVSNIYPVSFDSESNTSPQVFSTLNPIHGTQVAGVIGAVQNNNLRMSGVAPESTIISVSHAGNGSSQLSVENRARGMNWATFQANADIINCSWYANYRSQQLEDAIKKAILFGRQGKGAVVVFCSGNLVTPQSTSTPVLYPANFLDDILTVGSITDGSYSGSFPTIYNTGFRSSFSNYGDKLDVVAPGEQIYTLRPNIGSNYANGTSMSAAFVSGVAALVLSANPCLTGKQVRDIIEKTCKKIGNYNYTTVAGRPNGKRNIEVGYGLVDAHAAVLMAQAMNTNTLDLMIRDNENDYGVQPNPTFQVWNSPDIWVRNVVDGIAEHQNPTANSAGTPNYVYVRIKNKSCVPSIGIDKLTVNWAVTNNTWPSPWTGYDYFPGTTILMGNQIGNIINVPVIQPGEETIIVIPWVVPYPLQNSNPPRFSHALLARISGAYAAGSDPITYQETPLLISNVANNNNIAWKAISIICRRCRNGGIVNDSDPIMSGFVAISNPFNEPKVYSLELVKEETETGNAIYEEAEVSLEMDDVLFNAWQRGGNHSQVLEATLDSKKKLVKGNNVLLSTISLNANEVGYLNVNFNFLTEKLTSKSKYVYHIIQKDATGTTIGGESFEILKEPRPIFTADAGNTKNVDANEAITISATQISEPAIYNWYDISGNLIFTGKDLSIATQIATKYKLEVIATTDGFKDYSEVNVIIKPSTLGTLTPNPASDNVSIGYKVNQVGSAYLMVIGGYGTTSTANNYILDANATETTLNVTQYASGFYTLALVVNGQIVDAKTLIKQ